MAKEGKSTATPRLRFPEFRNAKAWEKSKLGSIATIFKGKGVAKSDVVAGGAHPCIRYGELYTRYGEVIETVASRTNAPLSDLFLSRRNDVIIPASGETKLDIAKASCVLQDDIALGSDLNVLRPADNGVFLSYLLNGSKRYEIARVAQGDSVVHLYPSQLEEIVISRPDLVEQGKIADCLMSLDAAIAAQRRKAAALQDQKRGLTQQLFACEGEGLPRLRFPEFRDAPEWVIRSFKEIYEFESTNTYSRDQLNYTAGDVKNIHYGDIHTKFATQFRIGTETVPFVNPGEPLAKFESSAYCQAGDMIFADASEDLADVGKSIEIVELNGEKVLSGSHTILARQRQRDFVVGFGAFLFKSRGVRAQIEKEAQGTKVMGISPSRLAGIEIRFPLEKAEQRRIAECLSSLDDQIAAEAAKAILLKAHKAGLMQQLFPLLEDAR
jgi:type I restriction enzyme S subunit